MTWLFQAVCQLFGHADTIRVISTRRNKLHNRNGPTSFVVVSTREFLACKRCGKRLVEIDSGKKMIVEREN